MCSRYFNPLFPYGKRPGRSCSTQHSGDFNPLFPYGKRRSAERPPSLCRRFQSTLPIREETSLPAGYPTVYKDFNPLFPYGKRLWEPTEASFHVTISIHSSHTGRDPAWLSLRGNDRHFNPLFPYGKRHPSEWLVPYRYYFNPLFPYGKRHLVHRDYSSEFVFQSTLPIREETGWIGELPAMSAYFNPLFPYGKRRDRDLRTCEKRGHFNPLFPYGKRLCPGGLGLVRRIISIHSSHTGRDGVRITAIQILVLFQSTLPIREETWRRWCR